MKLYYALDLKDDSGLIAEYEHWHRPENIWPEVTSAIRANGIRSEEIFRAGNRLVMVLDVPPNYVPQNSGAASNPRIEAWEMMMWRFQQRLPFAGEGEKWVPMTRIFSLRGDRLGEEDGD